MGKYKSLGPVGSMLSQFVRSDRAGQQQIFDQLRTMTGVAGGLTDIKTQMAAEDRAAALHPSAMRKAEIGAERAEFELGGMREKQAHQTQTREDIIRLTGEPLETWQGLDEATKSQIGYLISEAAKKKDIVPAAAAAQVAGEKAREAAFTLEETTALSAIDMNLPQVLTRAKRESALLQTLLEPKRMRLELDVLHERLLTEKQMRDPRITLLKEQADELRRSATATGSDNLLAMSRLMSILQKIEMQKYAQETYGKSMAELEIDRMMGEAPLTEKQKTDIYLRALDELNILDDPLMLQLSIMFGVDPTEKAAYHESYEAILERYKPKALKEPTGKPSDDIIEEIRSGLPGGTTPAE